MENIAAINNRTDIHSPIYYGLMLTGIFSLIFIVAKVFGLEHVIWLRFINYLAFFPVGYLALKNVYQATHKLDYFYGLKTAFLTCLFGQLLLAQQ